MRFDKNYWIDWLIVLLIAAAEKTIETRTWDTYHRGDLLICSSRKPAIAPAGFALAIVELYDCRPMTKADEAGACCELYDGAWAWILEDVKKIIHPFPVKGQLRLFEIELPDGIRF